MGAKFPTANLGLHAKQTRVEISHKKILVHPPPPPCSCNTLDAEFKLSRRQCGAAFCWERFLSILLTYMIAKCRSVSLLILRRSCVKMCPNKLKTLSTCLSKGPLQIVCAGCLLVPLDLSKHSTAKKTGKRGWTMCPAPAWDAAYCQSQGWNQTPLNYRYTVKPLWYWPSLTNNCSGMGLIFWSNIFSPKNPNPIFSVLWHAAACFKTPTNRPPKQVLRHAAACFNRWCLVGTSWWLGIKFLKGCCYFLVVAVNS